MARVGPILLAYLARGSEATSAEAYAVTSIYVAQAEKLLPSSDPDYRSPVSKALLPWRKPK